MAATVYKLASTDEQIDMLDPAATLRYIAVHATDEADARVAVNTESPAAYYGLSKRSIQMSEQGGGVWLGDVEYRLLEGAPSLSMSGVNLPPPGVPFPPPGSPGGPPAPPAATAALDETYAFQTTGGTQHITQSLKTVSKTSRSGAAAPDFQGAIGVNGDRVEGCDVFTGKLELTMTKEIPTVSLAYVKTLSDLTGTVNDDNSGAFYHFPAGSLLFLGATGQTRGPEDVGGWNVTYQFAVAQNRVFGGDPTDAEDPLVIVPGISDGLAVPAKDGWDYLWVYYSPAETENTIGPRPLAAYVERVYPRTDFRRLGIG